MIRPLILFMLAMWCSSSSRMSISDPAADSPLVVSMFFGFSRIAAEVIILYPLNIYNYSYSVCGFLVLKLYVFCCSVSFLRFVVWLSQE